MEDVGTNADVAGLKACSTRRRRNLPHADTSVVLEAFRISRPQPSQLLPLRCGLSCKQMC